MNFKTTLILLAVLLVVGTALIVMHKSSSTDSTPVDQTLLDIKAADVTSIAIDPADGTKIVLKRATSTDPWTIAQPITAAASADAVTSVLNDLTGLKSTSEYALTGAADELQHYGLDNPQYKVRISTADKDVSLLVGYTESVGQGVYVELDGTRKLEVVDRSLMADLQKKAADFRDKKLVPLTSTSDLNTVTISKPTGDSFTLTRDTSISPWRISAPTSMPADNSAVETMLNPLVSLTANSFVDDAASVPASQLKPQLTITYTPNAPMNFGSTTKPATQPSTTITFGQYTDLQKQDIYVQTGAPGVIAKVTGSTVSGFEKNPLDLRDKNLVTIDPAMVNKIALETEIPATTSPTSRPSITMGFSLSRRPQSHVMGPELPVGMAAATQAAGTQPTTQAAIAAATMPVVPPSTWVVDNPPGDADDGSVQNLLTALNPLTVDHFVDKLPTAIPAHIYRLKVTTVGPGGSPTTDYSFEFIDPNGTDQPYGTYDGVNFVAQRATINALQNRFVKSNPATQPAATQP